METIDLGSSAENLCTLENDIQDYENCKTTENVNTSSASESVEEYQSDVNKLITNMSNVSVPIDRLSPEVDKSCENSVQQNIKDSSINNKEDAFHFQRYNLDIQEEFNKHSYVSKDVEPSAPSSVNVLEGKINDEKYTISGVTKTNDISKFETNSDSNPLTISQERKRLKERFTKSKKKLNVNSKKSISTYTKKRKTKQNRVISEKDASDVKRIRDSTMTQSGSPYVSSQDQNTMHLPKSLLTLCTEVLHEHMYSVSLQSHNKNVQKKSANNSDDVPVCELSFNTNFVSNRSKITVNDTAHHNVSKEEIIIVVPLKQICYESILHYYFNNSVPLICPLKNDLIEYQNFDSFCEENTNSASCNIQTKKLNVPLVMSNSYTCLENDQTVSNKFSCNEASEYLEKRNKPQNTIQNAKSLKYICYKQILYLMSSKHECLTFEDKVKEHSKIINRSIDVHGLQQKLKSLSLLCLNIIRKCMMRTEIFENEIYDQKQNEENHSAVTAKHALQKFNMMEKNQVYKHTKKSTICFEKETSKDEKNISLNHETAPKSLRAITYQKIISLIYKYDSILDHSDIQQLQQENMNFDKFKVKSLINISMAKICDLMYGQSPTITMQNTSNFFLQIHFDDFSNNLDVMDSDYNIDNLSEGFDSNGYDYNNDQEFESDYNEDEYHTETQFIELKPYVTPVIQNICSTENNFNNAEPCSIQIKLEPENDYESAQQDIETSVCLKLEEINEEDDACDRVVPKRELLDTCIEHEIVDPVAIPEINESENELDSFEKFVTTVKPFSQSELRIRKQFEPDSDDENDNNMSLLIPHNLQPKVVQTAKKDLMDTDTSDEEKNVDPKKNQNNIVKTKRRKSKKNFDAKQGSKEETMCKEKPIDKEVQILTRRMREKLRQEGKQKDSSDSETDVIQKLNLKTSKKSDKPPEKCADDVQCSNVDSTQNIVEYDKKSNDEFSGFSAIDQNMISTYKQYVQCVYEKILPKISSEISELQNNEKKSDKTFPEKRPHSPLLMCSGPVEILKCEPTLLMFDEQNENESTTIQADTIINDGTETDLHHESRDYILKDGWTCYPLIGDDIKLHQNCSIVLDKLPEIFVETYFEYTKLKANEDSENDAEINRLVDFHSLHRTSATKNDMAKPDNTKVKPNKANSMSKKVVLSNGPLCDSVNNENLTELSPSEDEDEITANSPLAPMSAEVSQVGLAKDLLMNDSDSDDNDGDVNNSKLKENTDKQDEGIEQMKDDSVKEKESETELIQIKTEDDVDSIVNYDNTRVDNSESQKVEDSNRKSRKSKSSSDVVNSIVNYDNTGVDNSESQKVEDSNRKGRKSRSSSVQMKTEEPLVLTANKTLVKELDLLHAPVVLHSDQTILKESPSKNEKRLSKRKKTKCKNSKSGDSSSDEEKMWENTKEKLYKKMEKKIQENNSVDDAKRAKLVKEFLERHTEKAPTKVRGRGGRRSRKKFLERQKQLRVLTNELYKEVFNIDDPSNSTLITGKKQSYGYAKGRKNIRKVLDKKSLAKSTLLANKEEFDRKRRLAVNQNRLQELLGLEESVKAVVINDELCLQYDFDELQPLVSVHPFFTKVMKAHQCEGVKFMWDACFETVELVEAGHYGGGCILAHCMGLGKTLQVLALLHTVMSHPRVNMQRVLVVCPLSTVLNWVDEINKWLGPVDDQIKVFELSKLKKIYERAYQLEDWFKRGGILIIGYELFRSLTTLDPFLDGVKPTIIQKIRTSLLDPGPDVIICDEGHLLKNDCSVLAVAMSRVLTKRRIILTGTPMQNNLREYYCMVNFVKPNLLGKYSEYCNRFENPIINGQHRDSSDEDIKLMMARTHILHKVLEGCLQRQEVSVLYPYLPKKHEYTVFIALTKCQADLYKHYLQHFAKKSKQSVLKDFHVLQKIWSHPQVLHNLLNRQRDDTAKAIKEERIEDDLARDDLTASEDIKPDPTDIWWLQYLEEGKMLDSLESSNKFVTVFKIIDECVQLDDKLLIFSTSLYTMDSLEFFLKKIKKWSLGTEYYRLDGSVPPEVRQKWCREFNAENNQKTKLFLISTRAGSLGLNMTAANRVIILDTSWNPAHDIQSIFRVYRFGQKKDCYIYRLVAMGTMEQKMYERSVTKQAVACRVVDELQIDRHYNMTELTELYSFDELGEFVAGGVALGVRDIALLRVARDTPALHAVHEHDSLLRHTADMQLPEHERAAAWDQFQQEQARKEMQTELLEKSQLMLKRPVDVIQKPVIPAKTFGMQAELKDSTKKNLICKSKSDKEALYDPDLGNDLHPFTSMIEPEEDKEDPEYFPPDAKRRRGKRVIEPVIVTAGNSSIKSKETCIKNKEMPLQSNETSALHVNGLESNDLVKGISDIFNEHKLSAQPSEINIIAKDVSKILNQRYNISTEQIAKKIAEVFKAYHKESDNTNQEIICDEDVMKASETANKDKSSNLQNEISHQSRTESNEQQNYKQPLKLKIQLAKPTSQSATTLETSNSTKQAEPVDLELRIPKIKLRKLSSCNKETFEIDRVSQAKEQSSKKSERRTVNVEKIQMKQVRTASATEPKITSMPSNDPIVLSDDDDLSLVKRIKNKTAGILTPSSIPTTTTTTTSAITVTTTTDAAVINTIEDSETENEEQVPLHPGILKNPYFIKLVAGVYEKGNPMLDEDAALRAAEYSTNKAYDAVVKGNKPLTNGPLHKIAVELIGMQTMKKLWNSSGKQQISESNNVPEETPKVTTVSENTRSEPFKVFPVSTAIQSKQPVPVGIMKSSDNVFENQNYSRPFGTFSEECIVPDDNSRVTSCLPATVTTENSTSSLVSQQQRTESNKMSVLTTKPDINFGIVTESTVVNNVEKKTFILRRLDEKPLGNIIKLTPIMSKKKIKEIFKGHSSTKAKPSAQPTVNTVSNLIGSTICLDSDDETEKPPSNSPQISDIVDCQSNNLIPQPPNISSQTNSLSQKPTSVKSQSNAVLQAPSTANSKPSILSQNFNVTQCQPVMQITSSMQPTVTTQSISNSLLHVTNVSQMDQPKHPNIISPLITLVPSTSKENLQPKQPIYVTTAQIPAQNILVLQNSENIVGSKGKQNEQFIISNVLNQSSVGLPQGTNSASQPSCVFPISNSINNNVICIEESSTSTEINNALPHSPVECIEEFITPDLIVPITNVNSLPASKLTTNTVTTSNTLVNKSRTKTVVSGTSSTTSTTVCANKATKLKTIESVTKNSFQKHKNVKESNGESNSNNKQATDNLKDFSTAMSTNEDKYDSLFKNIVRIEADVYEENVSEKIKQNTQCTSKSVISPKKTENTIMSKSSITNVPVTNMKQIRQKNTVNEVSTITSTKPTGAKLSNTSTSLSSMKSETKKLPNCASLTSKVKPIDMKTSNTSHIKCNSIKQKVTDIVDLTDIESGPCKQKLNTKGLFPKNQFKSKDTKQAIKVKSRVDNNSLDTVDLTDLDEVVLSGIKKQYNAKKPHGNKIAKTGCSLYKKDNDGVSKRNEIVTVPQKKASEGKQIPKNVVTGTSKTIKLNKDKIIMKTDTKPSTSSAESDSGSAAKVIHIKKIYSSASSDSNKRKNCSTDDKLTPMNKKQKTSQFKSLEDFSFEDFEDIIELE